MSSRPAEEEAAGGRAGMKRTSSCSSKPSTCFLLEPTPGRNSKDKLNITHMIQKKKVDCCKHTKMNMLMVTCRIVFIYWMNLGFMLFVTCNFRA